MKTKTSTPKYGLIYHSTFIGRAGRQFKGRASRFLSNKLSIASRIDAFSGIIFKHLSLSGYFVNVLYINVF